MFGGIRKLRREPVESKASTEKVAALEVEETGESNEGAGNTLVAQIVNLEELVNRKTRDLETVKDQLRQLADTTKDSGEGKAEANVEELFTQPNQLKSEQLVQSDEEAPKEEKELDALLEKVGEEAAEKQEEMTKNEKEGEPKSEPESEKKDEAESDSLGDLFNQEEEEENPLAGLITSLPDVTVEELLGEAEEIKAIVCELQQS